MKKTTKRSSDSRFLSTTGAARSKAPGVLKPQRTMTSPTESLSFQTSNTLILDSLKSKMQTDESMRQAPDEADLSNETRAYIWARALKNEKMVGKLTATDKEIEQVQLDLPNQRVVNGDCMRTRVSTFTEPLKQELEKLLTFYCKREGIAYKQGLNEVAAPFINFRKAKVDLSNIYNYLVLFIDKFLPTAFIDKDFLSLQCCFKILNILLRYHDPAFYTFLERNDYPPEIYATPWFLTLFANKLSLEMVYMLWDIYILENDPYLIFFFSLALLLENKNRVMGSETCMIPQSLANLNIETAAQMTDIFKRAKDLRLTTPSSFLGSLHELDIFRKNYLDQNDLKMAMQRNMELLEQIQCILMSPHEIVNTLYSTELQCSNPKCSNYRQSSLNTKELTMYASFLSDSEIDRPRAPTPSKRDSKSRESFYTKPSVVSDESRVQSQEKETHGPCVFCKSGDELPFELQKLLEQFPSLSQILNYKKNQRPSLELLILDLRVNRDDGLLPKSHTIDLTKLNNDTINNLINDLIELRSYVHFVFMTSDFESASFRNFVAEVKGRNRLASPPPKKPFITSEMDEETVLFRFLMEFQQNGFPYLSILEGGFSGVNRVLHDVNVEVLNHNPEKCGVCNGKGTDKKNSLFGFFNRVFDKTGKKINLLVEGMNIKTPARGLSAQDVKSHSLKSQAFNTSKKEKPARTVPDLKEKPRSVTSIPTAPQTMTSISTNDVPEYAQASSYASVNGISRSRQAGGNFFKSNELLTRQRPPASEHVSIMYKEGEENIELSRAATPQEFEEAEKPVIQQQVDNRTRLGSYSLQPPLSNKNAPPKHGSAHVDKHWELPFKSYFDAQISPRIPNHTQVSLNQKISPGGAVLETSQERSLTKKENHHALGPASLGQFNTPTGALYASRYVFDSKRRGDETMEVNRRESTEVKPRRFVSPQEERNTLNETHKAKNSHKSNSVVQSLAFGKGNNVRKNMEENYHPKRLYLAETSGTRSSGTPIGHMLATEEDLVGTRVTRKEIFSKQNEENMYFSANESGIQKTESLLSPKAAMPGKKLPNYGKETYQSLRDVERRESGKESLGGKSEISLSLTTVQLASQSLASTIVEFPNISSFRKDGVGDRKESIEKGFDITAVKSPLRTMHSPSPIRGNIDLMRDRMSKERSDDKTFWSRQERSVAEEDKVYRDENSRGGGIQRLLDVQQNEYFSRNGIVERVKILQKDQMYFYKLFEHVKFSYFVSDHVWEIPKEDVPAGNGNNVQECLTKRILVISRDFLVSLQYENEVLDNLRLLQKGYTLEKMALYSEERRNLIGSLDMKTPSLKVANNMSISPKTSTLNGKFIHTGKEKFLAKREIFIEAMFPTKLLLRITSKKLNGKYLSFYFKLPTPERLYAISGSTSLTLTDNNVHELPELIKKDEYLRTLKEISDTKEALAFIQSKSLYCFESESIAQECIHKTKEAYNLASSYLNEKLGRK